MERQGITGLKAIFVRLADGNTDAFQYVFDNYCKRLQYVAIKTLKSPELAEEVVQDVLTAVWVNQAKFRQIRDPEGYIFKMLYNRISLELKTIASNEHLIENLTFFFKEETIATEDKLLAREKQSIINAAVEELPPRRKLIFKLSRQEGLTNEQIALQLNISRHTVKNQLVEALRSIRSYLDGAGLSTIMLLTLSYPLNSCLTEIL
jgi:RNA polymerase sigma-70 factor (ECF subfamily)